MGEKIKIVGNLKVGSSNFDIELNKATIPNGPRYIHIQNPSFRYCLTERDYCQFVADVMRAKKHFDWNKEVKWIWTKIQTILLIFLMN